ncbi:hypothetical protein BX616_009740 [Lobosporangium transversale]|uniref:Yeast cell wall synthesis Kre9/Knh1-like N-terminal domain-containing protein n=1 Tax=Lobosporangium transversale TaxID=64571 RepID=A0A1Y2GYQ0_9FUNG|nr:hypothetical protein BCR41DRAFT_332104 [Lobosporangium transversale]KAF9913684.1 hypothetical protein BX616_009740 [Lobosporangium transversale]ORZ27430.1 hypothetical protein BCR41DRAFT_332104 [Lobosporangium transversale]|eukprot:XP_021885157.1 hypothetical protein BCR41DRAFT_332104 [Lobosporangium transversale]
MLSKSLFLLAIISSAVFAEVYNPPITFPKKGDVFKAGETITVLWDTTDLPPNIPNKGMILLGRLTADSENLDVKHPLAKGFWLTEGSYNITFPAKAKTAHNYILALLGDSGNISKTFTICGKSK